jgi:hypothetical protein
MLALTFLVFFASTAVYSARLPEDDNCRVLVLSGGGSKGAYEAGVFEQFVTSLPP